MKQINEVSEDKEAQKALRDKAKALDLEQEKRSLALHLNKGKYELEDHPNNTGVPEWAQEYLGIKSASKLSLFL